jgi:hypothetical protein
MNYEGKNNSVMKDDGEASVVKPQWARRRMIYAGAVPLVIRRERSMSERSV